MRMCCVVAFAIVSSSAAVGTQGPADKPGAEQKNLARFAGTWKMEGVMEATPMGPGGKFTGTETCRMFDGGWHLVCETTGQGAMGTIKGQMMMTYDRGAKQYRYFSISNMPDASIATGTYSGNTWTWNGTMEQAGQKIQSRFTIVEKTPTVHAFSWEMSMDGKSWMKVMTGTSTKSGT